MLRMGAAQRLVSRVDRDGVNSVKHTVVLHCNMEGLRVKMPRDSLGDIGLGLTCTGLWCCSRLLCLSDNVTELLSSPSWLSVLQLWADIRSSFSSSVCVPFPRADSVSHPPFTTLAFTELAGSHPTDLLFRQGLRSQQCCCKCHTTFWLYLVQQNHFRAQL